MLRGTGLARVAAAATTAAASAAATAALAAVAALALFAPSPASAAAPASAPRPSGFVETGVRFVPLDPSQPLATARGSAYAGSLAIAPDGDGVATVNRLSVEDYVAGIAEMPPTWPAAALAAQAVAARSYALAHAAAPPPELTAIGAQICATQACQVYVGLAHDAEPGAANWRAAVAATAGQVLLYRGAPIDAMYSSSNGGQTVAGGAPYLWSVPEPDDVASPLHRWEVTISLGDLAGVFGLAGPVGTVTRTGDAVTLGP